MQSHTTLGRLAAIALAGIAWLIAIVTYQHAFRLEAAPEGVQEAGLTIIREQLEHLENNSFGRSERGRLILSEIRALLRSERVVFAKMATTRGLTWDPMLGSKVIYLKVIQMGTGAFLHQTPQQIMEALVHETVHSTKRTRRRISVEEECDCFVAGITAAASLAGVPLPTPRTIDGMSIAKFVLRSYPRAKRNPAYRPVGATLDWLCEQAGLKGHPSNGKPQVSDSQRSDQGEDTEEDTVTGDGDGS